MRKNLLLFSFIFISGLIFAQGSLQLFDRDGIEISNGQNIEVFVEDVSAAEVVSPELFIKNNTDSDMDISCLKTVVSEVAGTMNYFCALGTCVAPNVNEIPNPYTVPANTTVEDDGLFSSHYMPMSNSGTTELHYLFYNVNNEVEFFEFTVTFSDEQVSQASLQLFDHDGAEIINGSNIDVVVEDLSVAEAVSPELFVKNNADVDLNIKCVRTIIQDVDETMNYFCALGTCLAPQVDETPNPYTVPANSMLGEDGVFSSHYMPMNMPGTAIFSYQFYDVNNTNDTISFSVTFIGEEQASDPSMQLFTLDGTEIVNGHIFEVNIDDVNGEIESSELLVKNNSDNDINIRVRRDIIEEVEGSVNYFCVFGTCLSPEIEESSRDFMLTSGTTVGEGDVFYGHYSPMGNAGTTKISYKYFNVEDANDTISFEIHFDAAQGINDLVANSKISAFPNPANSFVEFNMDNIDIEKANLILYNAVGKEIISIPVNNESLIHLNISDLPKGVYLYRLEGNSKMSKTSKLIIQ